jgi:superoxide reductase
MKQKFLTCEHCGNTVALLRDKGVPIHCCGEEMRELIPGATEASGEKHIPVYETVGNTVRVTVGSTEHPMTADHYIEWICLETKKGIQYSHLEPGNEPKAVFSMCEGDEVRMVYAFCDQHGLWAK